MKNLIMLLLLMLVAGCSEEEKPQTGTEQEMQLTNVAISSAEKSGSGQVVIKVPAQFVPMTIIEDTEAFEKNIGARLAKIESNGTLIIVMPKSKHQDLLQNMRSEVVSHLDNLVADEDAASIHKIFFNDDFTELDILVEPARFENSLDSYAVFNAVADIAYVKIFEDNEIDVINVNYINKATNEIYDTVKYFEEN